MCAQYLNKLINMARFTDKNELIINSPEDLRIELSRYGCQSESELKDLLWEQYGFILIINYSK